MSNEPIHVLSVLDLSDELLARLRAVSPRLVVRQQSLSQNQLFKRPGAEQFAEVLTPEVEILYTFMAPFDLSLTPKLRWVQGISAGVDNFYDTPLWRSEIALTNASGVHSVQIAEYVLGMLLSYAHHFPTISRLQAEASWPSMREKLLTQIEDRKNVDWFVIHVCCSSLHCSFYLLLTLYHMPSTASEWRNKGYRNSPTRKATHYGSKA